MHVGSGICKRDVRAALLSAPHHFSRRVTGKTKWRQRDSVGKSQATSKQAVGQSEAEKDSLQVGKLGDFSSPVVIFWDASAQEGGKCKRKVSGGCNPKTGEEKEDDDMQE